MSQLIDDDTQGFLDELNQQTDAIDNAEVDMDFEFSSEETTESDLETSGVVDLPGAYHFEVAKVDFNLSLLKDDGSDNTPHIFVTCKVLESVKGQSPAGSALFHRIWVAQKDGSAPKKGSIESMQRFAAGIGLMTWATFEKDGNKVRKLVSTKTKKTSLRIAEFQDAVGLQFIANVKTEKSDDPKYGDRAQIPMGKTFSPNSPDVAHVPKNMKALIEAGYVKPGNSTGSSQSGSKPQKSLIPDDEIKAASSTKQQTTSPEEYDLSSL